MNRFILDIIEGLIGIIPEAGDLVDFIINMIVDSKQAYDWYSQLHVKTRKQEANYSGTDWLKINSLKEPVDKDTKEFIKDLNYITAKYDEEYKKGKSGNKFKFHDKCFKMPIIKNFFNNKKLDALRDGDLYKIYMVKIFTIIPRNLGWPLAPNPGAPIEDYLSQFFIYYIKLIRELDKTSKNIKGKRYQMIKILIFTRFFGEYYSIYYKDFSDDLYTIIIRGTGNGWVPHKIFLEGTAEAAARVEALAQAGASGTVKPPTPKSGLRAIVNAEVLKYQGMLGGEGKATQLNDILANMTDCIKHFEELHNKIKTHYKRSSEETDEDTKKAAGEKTDEEGTGEEGTGEEGTGEKGTGEKGTGEEGTGEDGGEDDDDDLEAVENELSEDNKLKLLREGMDLDALEDMTPLEQNVEVKKWLEKKRKVKRVKANRILGMSPKTGGGGRGRSLRRHTKRRRIYRRATTLRKNRNANRRNK